MSSNNSVPRLNGCGNNIGNWELAVYSYAQSIPWGFEVLKGVGFHELDIDIEEWMRIEQELYLLIKSTVSKKDRELVDTATNSSEALFLVKKRFQYETNKESVEVYNEFYALSAANYKSAKEFTEKFEKLLFRMELSEFSTIPREMTLRFLAALEPVLPKFCEHHRIDILRGKEVPLHALIADLHTDSACESEFEEAFAATAHLRAAKKVTRDKYGQELGANAKAPCEECGYVHTGRWCYGHPEKAPVSWRKKHSRQIDAARQLMERKNTAYDFKGFSASLHELMARTASPSSDKMEVDEDE